MNDQPFLVFAQKFRISITGMCTAGPGKITRHADAGIWVQPAEHPLVELTNEYLLHKLKTMISGTQSITMSKVKLLTIEFPDNWMMVYLAIYFLWQIIAYPQVMITTE